MRVVEGFGILEASINGATGSAILTGSEGLGKEEFSNWRKWSFYLMAVMQLIGVT